MKATPATNTATSEAGVAGGKVIVFGLFKQNGKVYTEIVPDAAAHTLQKIIRGHADIDSVIHSDGWRGSNGLVDIGYEKQFCVHHGNNKFSDAKRNHFNGIESFWGYAEHRLMKFKGIPKEHFQIHRLETEFRFNYRYVDLYQLLLKLFREFPCQCLAPTQKNNPCSIACTGCFYYTHTQRNILQICVIKAYYSNVIIPKHIRLCEKIIRNRILSLLSAYDICDKIYKFKRAIIKKQNNYSYPLFPALSVNIIFTN